jgi:hypothetical protein
MANFLYSNGKVIMSTPTGTLGVTNATDINLTVDTIKVALVTAGYTANQTSDQFYSTVVPASNVIGTPQQITTPTVTATAGGATFNGAGVTFTAVSGAQITQLVIYKDTGTATTSPLIANINVATGLPLTPNGSNVTVTWDSGTNKIFTL